MAQTWKETSHLIWTLTLNNDTIKLAVFRPTYDRERWHFSINDRDSHSGYSIRQEAKDAALQAALEQIEQTLQQLEQAKQEVTELLTRQAQTKA